MIQLLLYQFQFDLGLGTQLGQIQSERASKSNVKTINQANNQENE